MNERGVKIIEANVKERMASVRYELHIVIKAFDGTLQGIRWPTVFRKYGDAKERAIRLMATVVPDPDIAFEQIGIEQICEMGFVVKMADGESAPCKS